MTEREKFENAFPKLDLRREEDKYFSLHTNAYWVVWQAALSTRKPYGWGIVGRNGIVDWGFAHYRDEEEARQMIAERSAFEIEHPLEDRNGPYRVVELFYEDKE